MLVSFIINCVIFITKAGFNNSLSKGENSLQELTRAFVTIQNFIDSISISVRKVGTDLTDSTCSQALNYVGLQYNFTTNTDAVASNVDTIGVITGQIPDFIIYVSNRCTVFYVWIHRLCLPIVHTRLLFLFNLITNTTRDNNCIKCR